MILIYGAPSPLLVLGLARRGVVVLLLHGDVVVAALLQPTQQLVAFVQRGLENRIVVRRVFQEKDRRQIRKHSGK